jgi:hypothetical protein
MTRCNTCNGIVTRTDSDCFTCGEPVNRAGRTKRTSKGKRPAQVTPVTNLLFMASLVLTGVSFLSDQKMPVPVSASLSGVLFVARLVTDRKTASNPLNRELAPAPVNQVPPELLRRMNLG